jgi:hypothetical protein
MAAPHVTGAIARVWAVCPDCNNIQVQDCLYSSAMDLGSPGRDIEYGHGLVQKDDMYRCLATTCGCLGSTATWPSTAPSTAPSTSIAPSSVPSMSPSTTFFGACGNFAVHAGTNITFAGVKSTITNGDVGVSPGTSITGNYELQEGGTAVADSSDFAVSAKANHAEKMSLQEDWTDMGMAVEIGGQTFKPGTYRAGSSINFAYGTTVTLDGEGEDNPMFLFQAGTTLVTAAGTNFNLVNGAKAENIIWALGTAATLGANSVLEGSILAGTAITFGTESKVRGCAIAQSAVTFESSGFVDPPSGVDA